jgi:hypothetical protein
MHRLAEFLRGNPPSTMAFGRTRPGGRNICTFFLRKYDLESRKLMDMAQNRVQCSVLMSLVVEI